MPAGFVLTLLSLDDPAHKGIVCIQLGTIYGLKSRAQLAQILVDGGFLFRAQHQAASYLNGWSRDDKWAKRNCYLILNDRLMQLLEKEAPLLINGYPTTVHVVSADGYENRTRFRIVGETDAEISNFVKKQIACGLSANEALWTITECLWRYGVPARAVFVNDDGKKSDSHPHRDNFDVVSEFYDTEQARDVIASEGDLFLYTGLDPETTLFKTMFKLRLMDAAKDKSYKYRARLSCSEAGVRIFLRKAAGGTAAATIGDYILWRIRQELPHLRDKIMKIVVICHPDGQPNLKAGVDVFFNEGGMEAMFELYTCVICDPLIFSGGALTSRARGAMLREMTYGVTCMRGSSSSNNTRMWTSGKASPQLRSVDVHPSMVSQRTRLAFFRPDTTRWSPRLESLQPAQPC